MILALKTKKIISSVELAGTSIRAIEKKAAYTTVYKQDNSPLTEADLESDRIITEALAKICPGIPVISEESLRPSENSKIFWLLDPIDGTKEFIAGNGEYCISLALIDRGRPVEAYLHAPVSKITWFALKGRGAYRLKNNKAVKLPDKNIKGNKAFRVLKSRSHHAETESLWFERCSEKHKMESSVQGSAIKFARIAEGSADLHIKKGRIFGWDIAAGDLLLSESGGGMAAYPSGSEIVYYPENKIMPEFLAYGHRVSNPALFLL
ncbi:MAG: 3'(2'),5'-bisphosphate nucleotidase CysQ [Marinilabiliaceae bacterium]|jgi:3'(2'), 5'-bisphosphate nucleotidase|nr:3'(2'),5'-bisphosphate nucleotidase CysQ [Marinilabiliaceae bacterium]